MVRLTLIPSKTPLSRSKDQPACEQRYHFSSSEFSDLQKPKAMNMNRLAEYFAKAEAEQAAAKNCTRNLRKSKAVPMPHARLAAVVLLCFGLPLPALAYIDPNAGGMLYQALFPILAALVGGWTLLRNWFAAQWARLRRAKRPKDSSGVDQ